MTTERSDKIYENWRQASERFDYFVLGVTGALCAYVAQAYKPARLGFNPSSLELLALVFLVIAAIAGFRRVEQVIVLHRLNHTLLRVNEERGALIAKSAHGTPLINEATGEVIPLHHIPARIETLTNSLPVMHASIDGLAEKANRWYKLRNALIVAGFALLVGAKVWSAYV